MENFIFDNEEYNIIFTLVDESIVDINFKLTDETKVQKKFLFLPIIFDNKFFWFKKVKLEKRLYFTGYNIKNKQAEVKTIWEKHWEIENVKVLK